MFIILIFLVGVLAGFILKKNKKLIYLADNFVIYIVYLLIFFLGISVGSNTKILDNLSNLGLTAFIISLFALMGTLVFSYLLKKIFK